MAAPVKLSDQDILSRLTNTEDSTVERKTAADYRDCLKTAVAFSNSLPIGDPGIIFVGVRNDGTPQPQNQLNLDSLQINICRELNKIYPPIIPQLLTLKNEAGEAFLALIVRGSEERPHFAGQSYVRDGSQSMPASKEQFERLIAERSSKARKILEWRQKRITLDSLNTESQLVRTGRLASRLDAFVEDCNQFWVTVKTDNGVQSIPLRRVELSFDNENHRLKLEVYPL